MPYQDAASNHLGCAQDAGVGDRSPERRPQCDDGSYVRRPLGCNRTGDDASQAVADQMDPASGFGKRFLNGHIQLLPNQNVGTLRIEANT